VEYECQEHYDFVMEEQAQAEYEQAMAEEEARGRAEAEAQAELEKMQRAEDDMKINKEN
jgi:hypothetical protein